jgi:F-type H+-transporting ATPase subunit gamma
VRSTRDIRNKIRTVRNIEQICRAMKTVSSIRLRRAEQRLARSRPYHAQIEELVGAVAAVTRDHPFLQERPVAKTGVILVTSDRGLCGSYNAAAVRRAFAVGPPSDIVAVPIGRRGLLHLRREGYTMVDELTPIGGEPDVAAVYALAERIGGRYLDGEIDRLVTVHTRFLGGTRTEVTAEQVLPVTPSPVAFTDAIFEPEPHRILPGLMARYLQSEVLSAVLESSASEHAARVASMTAASDNANEMIDRLTLEYNKARQAGITKELTEIVSAADSTV